MAAGVVLSTAAFRILKAELRQLKLQYKNLTKRLVGKGRHRGPRSASIRLILCKADAAVSKGATGTFRIYRGTVGSEEDTGKTLQAYNRMTLLTDEYWVWIQRVRGKYEVYTWECAT